MSATYMVGEAKIFGADGTVTHAAAATTDHDPQSLTISDDFDVAEARNKVGDVKTRSGHNRRHTLTLQFLWRDAATSPSPTQATAMGKIAMPAPFTKVTLAGFGNALIDGDWNIDPGTSVELSNTGHASGTFRLYRAGNSPAAMNPVAAS